MKESLLKKLALLKTTKGIAICVGIVLLAGVIAYLSIPEGNVFAAGDYWAVNIGGENVVYLNSEEKALKVIEGVKNNYLTEGSEVISVTCDPEMVVENVSIGDDEPKPDIMSVDDAVTYITLGTKEPKTYTVKGGDTAWNIAIENDFSIDELASMNKNLDLEMLHPGDKIKLYEIKPFLDVNTVEVITSVKKIKYKTVYKETSKIVKGQFETKNKGENGSKEVTGTYTKVNGKTVTKDIQSETVLEEPVNAVKLKGTMVVSRTETGRTYRGSGQAVADYAMRFVGNPYSYGGTSLTNGADCSGFVLAVYEHFGLPLVHDADAMRNYGVGVSLSEAVPGDLVCYYGHVGIYVGGGRVVHAYNYGYGICVTGTGFQTVVAVRHIFD